MIEKTILDHLSGALDPPCCMERPANAPDKFVLLEKTGESRENHISTAILAVQCAVAVRSGRTQRAGQGGHV